MPNETTMPRQSKSKDIRARGVHGRDSLVEANPRPHAKRDAGNHFGPLAMYLAAGFEVSRTDPDGSVWVERPL